MARDNGEAGAEGQPARRAFPKGFIVGFAAYGTVEMRWRESGFQQRFYPLVELLEAGFADDHLAIDEKARRAIDLQHILGVFLDGGDLVLHRLVLQAILDRLNAEPSLPPDQLQRVA